MNIGALFGYAAAHGFVMQMNPIFLIFSLWACIKKREDKELFAFLAALTNLFSYLAILMIDDSWKVGRDFGTSNDTLALAGALSVALVSVAAFLLIHWLVGLAQKAPNAVKRGAERAEKFMKESQIKEQFTDKIAGFKADSYDPSLYEKALGDIEKGTKEKALWAKALVNSGGDEKKAVAEYIKLYVKRKS